MVVMMPQKPGGPKMNRKNRRPTQIQATSVWGLTRSQMLRTWAAAGLRWPSAARSLTGKHVFSALTRSAGLGHGVQRWDQRRSLILNSLWCENMFEPMLRSDPLNAYLQRLSSPTLRRTHMHHYTH